MLRLTRVTTIYAVQVFLGLMVGGAGWTELFAAGSTSRLESLSLAEPWKNRADEIALHLNPAWRAQLFFVNRVMRGDSSIIDSPEFFLAKDGKTNLKSELHASIDALFLPVSPDKADEHPRCRYPRRSSWLIDNLRIPEDSLPKIYCKELDRFLQAQSAKGISLVFASYFINNPASMFGHTFLRIHRGKGPGEGEPNALLDSAVNFAANPTTDNAFLYPLMGLTGQFPGTFSLMPYYLKVQEYNNSESRDLWEYPLNITQQQVDHLMLTLWEIGPVKIDYWYIDENCSYVLLLLLETLNPGMNLAGPFNVMATPADTVRAIVSKVGFTGRPSYRPSALSTYLQRESSLTDDGLRRMKKLIQTGDVDLEASLAGLTADEKAPIVDAALDYIDFDEEVAGNRLPEKQKQRRQDLLKLRSDIRTPPKSLSKVPVNEQPDKGHWSMRVGLSAGRMVSGANQYGLIDFDWRPTLHKLTVPSSGYSADLEMKMLEFKFRRLQSSQRKITRLESATLFEVISVPSMGQVKRPLSWTVRISSNADDFLDGNASCYRHSLTGGPGAASGSAAAKLFVLGLARIEANCKGVGGASFASGIAVGFLSELRQDTKLSLKSSGMRTIRALRFAEAAHWERVLELELAHLHADAHEISLFGKAQTSRAWSAGLSYGFYF